MLHQKSSMLCLKSHMLHLKSSPHSEQAHNLLTVRENIFACI
jgi:hypothetical protein